MIARNVMMVLVLTTLVVSSGCSSMKNLFFGRGARCGLSNTLGGKHGACPLNPFKKKVQPPACAQPAYVQPAPAYAPQYQAPQYQAPQYQAPANQPAPVYQSSPVVTAPPCQCESYGNVMGEYASCNDGYAMSHGGCGCGGVSSGMSSSYGPVVQDPYTSSGMVYDNGVPVGGNVISDVVIDNGMASGVVPGTVGSGVIYEDSAPPVADDGFRGTYNSQRPALNSYMTDQYDRDGHRILDRSTVD